MILELNDLIKSMSGILGDYTIYTTKTGKVVMRHKPRKQPSQAQIKHRTEFGKKYAGDWRKRIGTTYGELPKE